MDQILNENILTFATADAPNWTTDNVTVTDQSGALLRLDAGTGLNSATRTFTGFDATQTTVTLHISFYIERGTDIESFRAVTVEVAGLGSQTIQIEALEENERRLIQFNHRFDLSQPLGVTSLDVTIRQLQVNGSTVNYFIDLERISLKHVVLTGKTRCYFLLDKLFNEAPEAKAARLTLSAMIIDGVETLTDDFFIDQNARVAHDPTIEWDYGKCNFDSSVCSATQQYRSFNPFYKELGLDFNDVGGLQRGLSNNPTNDKDYGFGVRNIGVDKGEMLNGTGSQIRGAIFIDIDLNKSFFMKFIVTLSQTTGNAFKAPDRIRTFVIQYNPDQCQRSFYVERNDGGENQIIDLLNVGFLRGTLSANTNNFVDFPCDIADPAKCQYNERTLGEATYVVLPEAPPEDKGLTECCTSLTVLASTTDTDSYKNDYFGYYHKFQLQSQETAVFTLTGPSSFSHVLTDDTYGIHQNPNPEQSNLITGRIDWRKVLIANGPGNYTLTVEVTIAGITNTLTVGVFELREFDNRIADKTIRIGGVMNGLLERENVDFTNTNFATSIRLHGFVGLREPEYNETILTDENYNQEQINITQENIYTLQTGLVPECVSSYIFDFLLKCNNILLSDYNIINHSYKIDDLNVKYQSNEGTRYSNVGRNSVINLKFSERNINSIKRNY